MVGRAAQGRPWLPGQIARYLETGRREARRRSPTQFALIAALYDEMLAHHGLRIGLKHARKHLGWALDAAAASAGVALDTLKRWRGNVLTSETPADARARLAQAYDAFAVGARGMSDAELRIRRTCRPAPPTRCSTRCRCRSSSLRPTARSPTPTSRRKFLRGFGAAAAPADAARPGAVRQPVARAGRAGPPSRRRGERIQGRSVDAAQSAATGWSICMSRRCRSGPTMSW